VYVRECVSVTARAQLLGLEHLGRVSCELVTTWVPREEKNICYVMHFLLESTFLLEQLTDCILCLNRGHTRQLHAVKKCLFPAGSSYIFLKINHMKINPRNLF